LWLALRGANLSEIEGALRHANFWYAVPLLATLGLSYWVKAVRWAVLLAPLRATTARETIPAVMIGYASNIVLPAQLGEMVRVLVVGQRLGLRTSPVLATLVLERVFDFLTVLWLVGVAMLLDPEESSTLAAAGYVVGAVGLGMLMACLAFLRWTESILRLLERLLVFLPARARQPLLVQIQLGSAGLGAMKNRRLVSRILVFSILQWVLMGSCTYFSLVALNIEAPASAAFLVVAVTVAGLTLPSSPGYWGTIQLGFALALEPFGVGRSEAVAASIFWHVLAYVSVLVVGMVYAVRMGISIKEIEHRSEVEVANRSDSSVD
jgi:uncharacterized protein (TIRG00374 family)